MSVNQICIRKTETGKDWKHCNSTGKKIKLQVCISIWKESVSEDEKLISM